MAQLTPEEVRPYIATCGLSERKAASIVETSRLIEERHGGIVPSSFEELEALPGVGHKTASVVMNQAYGHPAFPVDTHIYRLARKWKLSKGTNVEQVERDLKNFTSAGNGVPFTCASSSTAGSIVRQEAAAAHARSAPP